MLILPPPPCYATLFAADYFAMPLTPLLPPFRAAAAMLFSPAPPLRHFDYYV